MREYSVRRVSPSSCAARLLLPPVRLRAWRIKLLSKVSTAAWGLFSCVVAMYAANQGSLIEVVNRYGSFFYGSILGVFILALLTKRATATGAFVGLIAGMAVVLSVAFGLPWVAFLWHNLIGAVVVVVVLVVEPVDVELESLAVGSTVVVVVKSAGRTWASLSASNWERRNSANRARPVVVSDTKSGRLAVPGTNHDVA